MYFTEVKPAGIVDLWGGELRVVRQGVGFVVYFTEVKPAGDS